MTPSRPTGTKVASGGRLRRLLGQLATTRSEQEAQELRQTHSRTGCVCIGELQERSKVEISGTVKSIALRPRATVPTLMAEVSDGTGILRLVWLGRREIPGITPGAQLTAVGRIANDHGDLTMYNPAYELLPRNAH